MEFVNTEKQDNKQVSEKLFRSLDRGIDDMEARRELPIKEAFDKISELRSSSRKRNPCSKSIAGRTRLGAGYEPRLQLSL